jgi:TonB-linked SusC/RagA family outer membrane protein
MTKLLKQSRFCRFLLAAISVLTGFAGMAQVTVKGKVTGENGKALSDINVTSASGSGASTDAKGNYSLVIPNSGTFSITASAIGFKPSSSTVTASGTEQNVDFKLSKDALGMDEVVVIGSSLSQSRKQLGNTINSVNAKQLQNTGSGNLSAALQGKVPGAQITQTSGDPAGSISIRMRGTSTISGSSEPLYVIDGVIINNSSANVTSPYVTGGREAAIGTNRLADINPNDIEKIDVIPGAAAGAIYGSRASNGVVLITTKKGKNGQMKIDFSTSYISNSLRKKVYVSKYGKMFGQKTVGVLQTPYALGNISNAPPPPPPAVPNNPFDPYTGGLLSYTRGDGQVRNFATDVVDVTRYDYQDDIFRTGTGTDNYLSMSGGTEKTKYLFSAGYFKNEGILVGTDFRRYNLKSRIEHNFSKKLSLTSGFMFTNSLANEKPNGNSFTSLINSMNITNNIYNIKERDAAGNLKNVDGPRMNPISAAEELNFTNDVNRIITDVQIKYKPIEGMSIDYILGIDNIGQEGNSFIKRYAYNKFGIAGGNKPLGYAASIFGNNLQINNDFNITYKKNFNKISTQTTAGFNHQFIKSTGSVTEGEDLLNGVSTISGAAVITSRYNESKIQTYGGFIQETFGIGNKFFLTAAGRIDGSTVFPKDNRNYFYPRVSAALNLSDYKFFKDLKIENVLSSLRLRSSWGIAGNLTGIGAYDGATAFTTGLINTSATFNLGSQLGNDNIVPERSREFEFGVDLSFLNDKIGVVFNIYDKQTIDNSLLVLRNLSPSSGGATKYENVGNMTNKGWELAINATPVSTKNFTWSLFGSLNQNKNLITKSTQVSPIFLGNDLGANSFIIQAGEAAGAFYGNYFDRDASGNIKLDASGRPLSANNGNTPLLKVLGSPHPNMITSFGTNLEYKNLSLNILFDGASGQQVFNADRRTRQGVGIGDLSEKELKGELPRGYIFSLYATEEYRIESGTYMKLRELSLTYKLPTIGKVIKSSSISLTGRNLYSWDTYDGYDPETNAGGNSSVLRGIDFGNTPTPRTIQLTLRGTF